MISDNLTDNCRVVCGYCNEVIDDAAPFDDHLAICGWLKAEYEGGLTVLLEKVGS